MDNIKAAADSVLRYLITRALFRGAVFKPPPNLEHQIRGGVRYLARGVLLNEVTMGRTPAIVDDRKTGTSGLRSLAATTTQSTWTRLS